MTDVSRRELLTAGLAAGTALAARAAFLPGAESAHERGNVHEQLLAAAAGFERDRRQRFAAVRTPGELEALQRDLRAAFRQSIGGLPKPLPPPTARVTGQIRAEGYTIEKLAFESLPGYFVSALLYRPTQLTGRTSAVLSLCGHTPLGKAADAAQVLNANLARRGHIVLACDPVGQAERSQFWDSNKNAPPFGLACGEHAVLGNPLYLLGASLARYEIWDAMRAIDFLTSLAEVDAARIGCVGASGGGTQTAYLAALDQRVAAAAIVCYITTLPRRMANRIEADPDADPEQDPFGLISAGIDHAGLLAMIAPRPTLLGTARFDFFPIEGVRESFAEVRHLYEVCGRDECLARVEVPEKHGFGRRGARRHTPGSIAGSLAARAPRRAMPNWPKRRARRTNCSCVPAEESIAIFARGRCSGWHGTNCSQRRKPRRARWANCCKWTLSRPTRRSTRSNP